MVIKVLLIKYIMEEKCQGKSVPWSDMQQYLDLHKTILEPIVEMNKTKLIRSEFIEQSLPPHLLRIHEFLTDILKHHKVIEEDQRKSEEDIQLITRAVLRAQEKILQQGKQTNDDITKTIDSLHDDFDSSLSEMQKSIMKSVISELKTMSGEFERS